MSATKTLHTTSLLIGGATLAMLGIPALILVIAYAATGRYLAFAGTEAFNRTYSITTIIFVICVVTYIITNRQEA